MKLFSLIIDLDTLPECDYNLVDRQVLINNLITDGKALIPGQKILYVQFKFPGGWQYCVVTLGEESTNG